MIYWTKNYFNVFLKEMYIFTEETLHRLVIIYIYEHLVCTVCSCQPQCTSIGQSVHVLSNFAGNQQPNGAQRSAVTFSRRNYLINSYRLMPKIRSSSISNYSSQLSNSIFEIQRLCLADNVEQTLTTVYTHLGP